jgi:hypothetical protein
MTEKIEELGIKQGATTERNQETIIQDNNKLLSPKTGALSVLSYPPKALLNHTLASCRF